MNRLFCKITASFLTAIAIVLFAAGCNSEKEIQSGLITDLSKTRFCTTTLNLPDDGLGSRYSYRMKRFIGITDDRLVFYVNSSCIKSNGKQNEIVDELLVYDTSGNQTSHIYLKDIFRNICENSRVRIESVTKENRLYSIIASVTDNDYNLIGTYKVLFDAQDGTVSQMQSYKNDYPELLGDSIPFRIFEIDGFRINAYAVWSDHLKYYLTVTDSEGNTSIIDIEAACGEINAEVTAIISKGDGSALVCMRKNGEESYAELEMCSAVLSKSSEDYSWLRDHITGAYPIDGLGTFVTDAEGIYIIDFTNRKISEVFNYENSNAGTCAFEALIPVKIEEDRIILAGVVSTACESDPEGKEESIIVVFDRAD